MGLLIALALGIGILLGLLGGGGSILTVPVLVYLAGLPTKSAIITSLIVVCITSTIATISYARSGKVCWRTGITFGLAGMLGAFIGGRLTAYIPDTILLALFAMIMLITSFAMLNSASSQSNQNEVLEDNFCPITLPVSAILFDGLLVGLITGLVGVGGGFLLVPALTILAGLPIQAAIGTSLFIIIFQSAAALAGHANQMSIDIELTTTFTLCAITGSLIGTSLSGKIDTRYLKTGFGFFVFFLGSFLFYTELTPQLISQIKHLIIEHQEFLKGALTIIISLFLYRLWTWLHSKKPS